MNRDLEIALLSGALTLIGVYGVWQRFRESDFGGFLSRRIKREDAPVRFWITIFSFVLVTGIFGGVAIWHFALWL